MVKRKTSSSPTPSGRVRRGGPAVAWTPEELTTVLLFLVTRGPLTLSKADLEKLQELLPGRTAEGIRLTWKNKLKPQCQALLAGDAGSNEKKPVDASQTAAKSRSAKKEKGTTPDAGSE